MIVRTTQVSSQIGCRAEAAVDPLPMRRVTRAPTQGDFKVTLHRNECGVVLVRDEHRSNGPHVEVVAAFTQPSSFEDWCAGDPMRFAAPIVLEQVRRDVEGFLRNDL